MANKICCHSSGTIESLPIKINEKMHECEAIVLDNSAMDLLIGTNWLRTYKPIIDLEQSIMKILDKEKENNNICEIYYKKMENIPLKEFYKNEKVNQIQTARKTTLKPFEERFVKEEVKENLNNRIPNNSLLHVTPNEEKEFMVAKGVFDVNYPPNELLIANPTENKITIQLNEIITYMLILEKCIVINNKEDYKLKDDLNLIEKSYKGPEDFKQTFMGKMTMMLQEKIIRKNHGVEHEININDDKEQIHYKPYKTNQKNKIFIENKIEEMLKDDIIRESNSNYGSPIVLVNKDKKDLRFYIDYRALNRKTVKDRYSLPLISNILDSLSEAKYFSKIDLKSGYWQIPVKESDKPKTAFIAEKGLYEFNVLPFGLCNGPATFQRLMNRILRPFNWKYSLLYLDDIIIFSKDINKHCDNLVTIFRELKKYNLKIKHKKSKYLNKKNTYLGH